MYSWKSAVLVQLAFCVAVTIQADMCGLPAPDPMKTCISVRLPWNPMPMYFCTEKNAFRYRNQCQNRFANSCGINTIRQDVLMVASPWDCCPLVSYPDSCVNQQCSPPPHNRKCQTIEPNPNTPWECCNNYFCEENMTPETCHFKRLEQTCNNPPTGKTNCVSFYDNYGCCPKFQCDGDAIKPGSCPAEVEAMKFMARFNATNMMFMGPGFPMPGPPGLAHYGMAGAGVAGPGGQVEVASVAAGPLPASAPQQEAPAEREGELMGMRGGAGAYFPSGNPNTLACVGDFNCPGNMKCCSSDMNVYLKDGQYFFRNRNPTYGYCVEPTTNAVVNTKSIKYTAALVQ